MSATLDIAAKRARLLADGLDLGTPTGPEADAGFGGRVQAYAAGRIYWHAQTGTHEVHGAILGEYLRLGGPGPRPDPQPGASARPFGFPTTDETRSADDIAQVSEFEWGAICWGHGTVAVPVFGPFFPVWKGYRLRLGFPLDEPRRRPSGAWVLFCQFGCLFTAGSDAVHALAYRGPRLGRPGIATPDRLDATAFDVVLPTPAWDWLRANDPDLPAALWQDRLVLRAVAAHGARATAPVPLRVERSELRPINGGVDQALELRMALAPGAALAERTLYDLALATPGRTPAVMVPHCFYAKSDWSRFGAMHATDIHVAERADRHHGRLLALGRAESAAAYNNFNENFRDVIAYANRLHEMGALDLVIVTGDLVDYQFEKDQDPGRGWGNFLFFERMLRGEAASPVGRPVEALRVPIFTTLGNHDYRQKAYELFFDAEIPLWPDHEQSEFGSHNLTEDDARALQGGKPTLSSGAALDMVRLIRKPEFYHQRINPTGSEPGTNAYVVALGPHRLVMLDSGHDLGVTENEWDAFTAALGFADADEKSFVSGSPNQQGVSDAHLRLLEQALGEAGEGVVLVGLHGPPLNLPGSRFVDFLRENAHRSADPRDVAGYLRPGSPKPPTPGVPGSGETVEAFWASRLSRARREQPGWMDSIGQPFFMHGSVDQMLDTAVSKGRADAFLQMCAGAAARPVDLVLCGHGHDAVEYRLQWTGRELRFFTDFYSSNPRSYYGTRRPSFDFGAQRIAVGVVPGAAPNAAPRDNVRDARWDGTEWQVEVPPYDDPLDRAPDIAAWWGRHRPLVVQTGAVGPRESRANSRRQPGKVRPDPSFQGFRMLGVEFNTILSLRYIRLEELRAGGLTMPDDRFSGALVRFRNVWKPERSLQAPSLRPDNVRPGRGASVLHRLEPTGNGVARIRDGAAPARALHVETGEPASGPVGPGWLSARWVLEPVPGGPERFRLRSAWKPDQCLHVETGPLACGPVGPGWLSAMWTLELAPPGSDPGEGPVLSPLA